MPLNEGERLGLAKVVTKAVDGYPVVITDQGEDVAYVISKRAMDSLEAALRHVGSKAIDEALDKVADQQQFSSLSEACARLGVNIEDVIPGGAERS